ncbi:MAG: tRNA 2-selenouridine(34) synthase MnmH [Myxococcota bacterium]|nr:tRNA 2-selenouridine(34) synthase MnmH [Myxococcota bacterium]
MVKLVSIEEFLALGCPIIDVRAPVEYEKSHIPGAIHLPLFDDAERAQVGALYKQRGRRQATLEGLGIVGSKLRSLAEKGLSLSEKNRLAVHCFRGGMRSQAVAWLLDLCQVDVFVLEGGYKAFRKWVFRQFEKDYSMIVLGGFTGSAKSEVLNQFPTLGEQIIDLEKLANHKGSAFGALGLGSQPSQSHFENLLAMSLSRVQDSRFWVEDESRMVGKVVIPKNIWSQIRLSNVLFIERTLKERTAHLLNGYGSLESSSLVQAASKIRKRFGPDRTDHLVSLIESGSLEDAVHLALQYYDKGYLHGLQKRPVEKVHRISAAQMNDREVAVMLKNHAQQLS